MYSDHFRNFTSICFEVFGDGIKYWTTLNEPWLFSFTGYVLGALAPDRCSTWQQLKCTGGDSAIEPYIVSHNQLLACAAAIKLYKDKY